MNKKKKEYWLSFLPVFRSITAHGPSFPSNGICYNVRAHPAHPARPTRAGRAKNEETLRQIAIASGYPALKRSKCWFAGWREYQKPGLWGDGKRMELVEKMIEFLENLEREDNAPTA